MTGFSGVQPLNAVVWEVEDLCHMFLLDGPIAGVIGYMLCATTDAVSLDCFCIFFTFYSFILP